ncbi:hypothetical protein [Streptomyces sp. A5-4]
MNNRHATIQPTPLTDVVTYGGHPHSSAEPGHPQNLGAIGLSG